MEEIGTISLIGAIICAIIAQKKNRIVGWGLFWGAFLGLFAVLIYLCLDNKTEQIVPQEEKDLCKTCKHYWTDFPLSLDHAVSHCEILDKKKGLSANMDSEISYPCLKCPFNCYIKESNPYERKMH